MNVKNICFGDQFSFQYLEKSHEENIKEESPLMSNQTKNHGDRQESKKWTQVELEYFS